MIKKMRTEGEGLSRLIRPSYTFFNIDLETIFVVGVFYQQSYDHSLIKVFPSCMVKLKITFLPSVFISKDF